MRASWAAHHGNVAARLPSATPNGLRFASSVFVLLFAIAACGGDHGAPAPPPPKVDGDTCILQASTAACPGGTRPAIGTTECLPVGPTTCAPGFERDASGFGCAAVLPPEPAACAGATRPALGEKSCVPVGDCNAPFPPPNAILVDPAGTTKTLADAIAAAPTGGTIALADGTHTTDALTIAKDVTIVGRCAAKTRLVAATSSTRGLDVRATTTVRGLTIASFSYALAAKGALDLTLEDVVIENATTRALIGEESARIVLRRSVVRGTKPASAGDQTLALAFGADAQALVEESAITSTIDGAIVATETSGTRVELVRSVVADTRARADKRGGAALRAFEGAKIDVTESAVLGSTGSAILTFRRNTNKSPPEVTVKRSVLGGTRASEEGGTAIGTTINAAFDAKVRVEDTTIADIEGSGLYSAMKARIDFVRSAVLRSSRTRDFSAHATSALKEGVLAFEDSAIVRAGGLGVGGWERGRATLVRSLVRDIGGDTLEGLPTGQGLSVHSGSVIEATDSALVDVLVANAAATKRGSAIRLERVLITRGDGPRPTAFNHGLLSVESARVDATSSIIERLGGVAIVGASGGGVITQSIVRDNAIAVQVQEGSSLTEVDATPEAVGDAEIVIVSDTRFSNNESRVGSGALPLPGALTPF